MCIRDSNYSYWDAGYTLGLSFSKGRAAGMMGSGSGETSASASPSRICLLYTSTAICKLKDNNGQPYFKEDEYKILGRPVIESDSMPIMAAGKKPIIFGDLSGYTIKATKSVEVQVLREKFATKNMIGVLAFGEYDAKITDSKKVSSLTMAAS